MHHMHFVTRIKAASSCAFALFAWLLGPYWTVLPAVLAFIVSTALLAVVAMTAARQARAAVTHLRCSDEQKATFFWDSISCATSLWVLDFLVILFGVLSERITFGEMVAICAFTGLVYYAMRNFIADFEVVAITS